MDVQEEDLRDTLSKAWDEDQEEEENEETGEKPAGETEEEETGGSGESTEESVGDTEETEEERQQPDESKSEDTQDENQEEETSTTEEEDKDLKVPNTWKAAAREHWGDIPAAAKREILRRESEVKNVLDQRAQEGQFARAFQQTIAPFQNYIAASGGNPLQSIHNLMATAAVLQGGTKHQRAQLVKDVINNFDVDIDLLDQMLAGQAPQEKGGNSQDVERLIDQRLAPINQFIQSTQQSQQSATGSEIEKFFNDPANEFAGDVADDMADILELAARRGVDITLKDAYDRAIQLNPEIGKIVAARKEKERRKLEQKKLEEKRRAASSISGNPAGNLPEDSAKRSLRQDLEAAWDTTAR